MKLLSLLAAAAVAAGAAAERGRVVPPIVDDPRSSRFVDASRAIVSDEAVVNTPSGPVMGQVFPSYRLFQGVPYSTPITPATRWSHSSVASAWGPSVLNATVEGPGCPQLCWNDEPPHICPAAISEDCLFMNIFTPRAASLTAPVPVIMFIHGGNFHDGYTGGTSLQGGLLYDGSTFVNTTGQIIVTINYRLGAFGFLYLGTKDLQGNFGLEDQMTAVKFLKANIAAFGGDPERITLMGQSAGAMSISAHLSRPQTQGLYAGAIMHSNPHAEPYRNAADALALAAVFGNYSGCPYDLTKGWSPVEGCLRQQDMATLLNAQVTSETDVIADLSHILQIVVVWSPTVGTAYLPTRPLEAFQAGNVVDVPIMIGTVSNETVIFVYEALNTPMSESFYTLLASVLIGAGNFDAAKSLYPMPSPPLSDYRVFSSYLLTDGLFLCPTRNATEALYVAQPYRRSATYHWLYSHQMSWSQQMWGTNFTECWDEVCHGSDLPGWWHPTEAPAPGYGNYSQAENVFASTMQGYWATFAATGNPGTGITSFPGPKWPAYDAATRQTLRLEAGTGAITPITAYRAEFCALWDNLIGYNVY